MFNKVGAAYMFVMSGGSLFFSLGVFGSEAGTLGTAIGAAIGLVFTLGFARRLADAPEMTADHPYDFERPMDVQSHKRRDSNRFERLRQVHSGPNSGGRSLAA